MLEVTLSGVCFLRTLPPFPRHAHGVEWEPGGIPAGLPLLREMNPKGRKGGGKVTVK